jgi:hypothetical protein
MLWLNLLMGEGEEDDHGGDGGTRGSPKPNKAMRGRECWRRLESARANFVFWRKGPDRLIERFPIKTKSTPLIIHNWFEVVLVATHQVTVNPP